MKNNLRKLRIKQSMNQRRFAEACHTPQSLVSDIERGTKAPWPAFINRVCAVLKVDTLDIFPGYIANKKETRETSLAAGSLVTKNTEEVNPQC